MNTPFPL
jgi:hypothetical protein